jgi:hypothetical protein
MLNKVDRPCKSQKKKARRQRLIGWEQFENDISIMQITFASIDRFARREDLRFSGCREILKHVQLVCCRSRGIDEVDTIPAFEERNCNRPPTRNQWMTIIPLTAIPFGNELAANGERHHQP